MALKTLEKPVKESTQKQEEVCVHYWVIEPPENPVSKGICRKCGEEQEFQNYYTYSTWESVSSTLDGLGIDFDIDQDNGIDVD